MKIMSSLGHQGVALAALVTMFFAQYLQLRAEPAMSEASLPEAHYASQVFEAGADVYTLDELVDLSLEELLSINVVSSSLTAEPVSRAPATMTVLTRAQIEALGLRTLNEAVQLVAGTSVLELPNGRLQYALRGLSNPAQIAVILDGQPLNDFYDGEFAESFPLDCIERIEIIRGPGSALYGTNAFAGVISLFSCDRIQLIEGRLEHSLSAAHRPRVGGTGYLRVSQKFSNWELSASLAALQSQGPRLWVEEDISRGIPAYSTVPGVSNSFRNTYALHWKVQRRQALVPLDQLSVVGLMNRQSWAPFFGAHRTFENNSRYVDTQQSVFLEYSLPLLAYLSMDSRVFYDTFDGRQDIQEQPPGYFFDANGNGMGDESEIFREGKIRHTHANSAKIGAWLHLRHEVENPSKTVKNQSLLGVQVEYNWMNTFDYAQNYLNEQVQPTMDNHENVDFVQARKRRTTLAFLLQDRIDILNGLHLTAGLRVDYASDYGTALSPRVVAIWDARSDVSLKLGYGRAFRAPTFRELYDRTSLSVRRVRLIGNPDLRAETTGTLEAACNWRVNRSTELRLTGFLTHTDNIVDLDTTYFVGGSRYVNYPGIRVAGVEVESEMMLFSGIHLLANLSYSTSKQLGEGIPGWEEDSNRRFVNTDLEDLPRLRGNVASILPIYRSGQIGLRYSYLGKTKSRTRFVNEALFAISDRQPFHELALTAGWRPKGRDSPWKLGATIARTFDKSVPVSLSYELYPLDSDSLRLLLSIGVH